MAAVAVAGDESGAGGNADGSSAETSAASVSVESCKSCASQLALHRATERLHRLLRALEAHDGAAYAALCAPDIVVETPSLDLRLEGRELVRDVVSEGGGKVLHLVGLCAAEHVPGTKLSQCRIKGQIVAVSAVGARPYEVGTFESLWVADGHHYLLKNWKHEAYFVNERSLGSGKRIEVPHLRLPKASFTGSAKADLVQMSRMAHKALTNGHVEVFRGFLAPDFTALLPSQGRTDVIGADDLLEAVRFNQRADSGVYVVSGEVLLSMDDAGTMVEVTAMVEKYRRMDVMLGSVSIVKFRWALPGTRGRRWSITEKSDAGVAPTRKHWKLVQMHEDVLVSGDTSYDKPVRTKLAVCQLSPSEFAMPLSLPAADRQEIETTVNKMLMCWINADREGYSALISDDMMFIIPHKGLDGSVLARDTTSKDLALDVLDAGITPEKEGSVWSLGTLTVTKTLHDKANAHFVIIERSGKHGSEGEVNLMSDTLIRFRRAPKDHHLRWIAECYSSIGQSLVSSERSGYIWKQGHVYKSWRRRFLTVSSGRLVWRADEGVTDHRGVLDLTKDTVISLTTKTHDGKRVLKISSSSGTLKMHGESDTATMRWAQSIDASIAT